MAQEACYLTGLLGTTLLAVCIGFSPSVSASNDPFLGFDGPILPNPYVPIKYVEPYGMLGGDFNEDGFKDLAAFGGSGLLILLGNGDRTFSETYYFGFYGTGAIGDFNEDGHQDLVLAKGLGAEARLGNGDGTFGAPIPLQVFPVVSFGVAVGDFDNDNSEDVVAGGWDGGSSMAFFAGNGDGTFLDAVVTNDHGLAWDIGVGDFDEDGNLDFVGASVWLGSGNGSFTRRSYAGGELGLEVFDFDGDTHLDFARLDWDSGDLHVRLGNGDGTFAEETTYAVGNRPRDLLVHDVDGDGNVDLLVGKSRNARRQDGMNTISVLPGNGDGTFGPRTEIPVVNFIGPMVIADFDNDGQDELAALQLWDQLIVLPGHGGGISGAAPATVIASDPFGYAVAATFGDVNGDGLPDVVRVRDDPEPAITVMVADGSGGFDPSTWSGAGTGESDVAIADLDNDKNPDVIVTNRDSDDASILLGNGDGSFAPVFSIPLISGPVSIVTGRFDKGRNVDLAVLAVDPMPFGVTLHPAVHIFSGRGNGTFSLKGSFPVGSGPLCFYCSGPWIIETGDFNEDGETDLILYLQRSTELSVLIGVGDGTFQPEVRYEVAYPTSLTVGDVNDDGHEDLLLSETYDVLSGREDNEVLYGVGDGTFAAAVSLLPDPDPAVNRRVGDLNGDGRVDLVGREGGGISLRLGHGDGTFGEPSFFGSALGGYSLFEMVLDDADGDGRLDVIVTDEDEIVTLLNVCDGCDRRIAICHRSRGNPARAVTMMIAQPALPAHLAHGDVPGPCAAKRR